MAVGVGGPNVGTRREADMTLNIEEGFAGGGPVVRNFPTPGNALLSSFYFQYVNDDHELSSRLDRHVLQVMAMPGFPATGKIELGMHEEGSDTDYFFNVRHHVVTTGGIQPFSRALDVGAGRQAQFEVERPEGDFVFVLTGFQLAFHGTDHHLDEAGIFESNGAVTVRFNDKNDDDTFKFALKYCYVPRATFSALGIAHRDNVNGGDESDIPGGDAVIRGFNLNFRSKDHHIRGIGALAGNGRARVFLEDQNGDDRFDWSLRWAVLV
jgi:hypothetical protein